MFLRNVGHIHWCVNLRSYMDTKSMHAYKIVSTYPCVAHAYMVIATWPWKHTCTWTFIHINTLVCCIVGTIFKNVYLQTYVYRRA